MKTIERINRVTLERAELFRKAANGRRGDAVVRERIRVLDLELKELWDRRRIEKAGQRDGVDLLVDRAYERIYGDGYEDIIAPPTVGEPEPEKEFVLAA